MKIGPECAVRLSQAGRLGGMFRPAGPGQFALNPAVKGELSPLAIEKALEANGVSALMRRAPLGRGAMAGFGEMALLAGLLASINNNLKVNLLKPNAANLLSASLQNKLAMRPLNVPPLPALRNAPPLPQLMQLANAAQALRSGPNIDIFSGSGAVELNRFLSAPAAAAALPGLGPLPKTPALRALSKLSMIAAAPRALSSLGLPAASMSAGSPFQGLRAAGLASLWPAVTGGSLGQIRLPNAASVASFNANASAIRTLEKLTGLKATDPRFNAKLSQMMAAFQANNICGALHASPLGALKPAGGGPKPATSLEGIKGGLGVNLLEAGAGSALAPKIAAMGKTSPAGAAGAGQWNDVIPALKRLAELGTALA